MGVVRGSEVLIDPGRGRSATARIRGYESSTPHLGCFWGYTRNSIDLRSQQFMRLQRKCASPSHKALKESELPEFLEKLDAYDGNKLTQLAMRFLMLTFVRTGEMRGATWNEFDIEKAEWRIPAERMKMGAEHIVPLSRQALDVIDELRPLSVKREHLFPNEHDPKKFMSENTVLFALYRMGYRGRATGHGFRATASTILNEHGFRPDVIERQLAHAERNKIRAAYHRSEYLPDRRKLMQHWADFLDGLGEGRGVVPFRRAG